MARNQEGIDDAASAAAGLISDELLASLGLDEFVPARLARWRPLVIDALAFFLGRLPVPRLMTIVADQFALPLAARPAARLVTLLAHCPTLHKLGQVLARYPHLDPELRAHLQSLESLPPTVAMSEVRARIQSELPGKPAFVLADEALAEGSLAVVVPFTYREGGDIRHGVFKVLKPGIEAALAEELEILGALETHLEARRHALRLPALDFRDALQTVQRLLVKEVRLEIEQANMRAAAAFYAGQPAILVPRLLPWCTPRLTAMERVFGVKLVDAPLADGQARELADRLVQALIAQPFWNPSETAVFHADLHGGNLFLSVDGRVAVLDWSLTARLSKRQREGLVAIALGALALDARSIRTALSRLGTLAADDPVLDEVVEQALDQLVRSTSLPGFDWLVGMLDTLALRAATGFSEDFTLFRKTWFSLAGINHDLVPDYSPDETVLSLGLRRFFEELPQRWMSRPDSRAFATHVSNLDVMRLVAASWLISSRYWLRRWAPAGLASGWL